MFEQAHVQHTQCSPSRCAIMTGRYMHVMGHRTQTHLVQEWEPNVFAYLKASGYTTLIDAVHSSVLLYILLATASGVVAWRRYQRQEDSKAIQWQERRMAGLTSLGFAALILAQILAARSAGAT